MLLMVPQSHKQMRYLPSSKSITVHLPNLSPIRADVFTFGLGKYFTCIPSRLYCEDSETACRLVWPVRSQTSDRFSAAFQISMKTVELPTDMLASLKGECVGTPISYQLTGVLYFIYWEKLVHNLFVDDRRHITWLSVLGVAARWHVGLSVDSLN